jgi:hypothetical protein
MENGVGGCSYPSAIFGFWRDALLQHFAGLPRGLKFVKSLLPPEALHLHPEHHRRTVEICGLGKVPYFSNELIHFVLLPSVEVFNGHPLFDKSVEILPVKSCNRSYGLDHSRR